MTTPAREDCNTPQDVPSGWTAKTAFRVEDRRERDIGIVVPVGELDLSTAPRVDEHLSSLVDRGTKRLVLDLRKLTFIDSTGLRLVLSWDERARSNGLAFGLIQGGPEIARVFEITQLVERLSFVSPDD